MTGSDQVWNPYQPYCIEPYFLTFAPQGKREFRLQQVLELNMLKIIFCKIIKSGYLIMILFL